MKLIFNVKNKLENCTINVILEQIYLILFSILLIYQFFFTTMFSIEWPVIIQTYLRTIIILLLVLKTAVDEKPSISEFIIMFALGLIFLLSWKNNGGDEIFLCLLSIWGARNIDFKKILKVFFGVILFLLIFTMISALRGCRELGLLSGGQTAKNGIWNMLSYRFLCLCFLFSGYLLLLSQRKTEIYRDRYYCSRRYFGILFL